jgi:aminopeptidase N
MRRTVPTLVILPLVLLAGATRAAADPVHHDLRLELDAAGGRLGGSDRITLPPGPDGPRVEFLLNSTLTIRQAEPGVEEVPLGEVEGFFGINSSSEVSEQIELKRYRLTAAPPDGILTLRYDGPFDFGLSEMKEEYTRGFRETAGIIGKDGVYLAGGGFWYPVFDDELLTFDLDVGLPDGWHVVSQGDGTSRDEDGRARWDSGGLMDEIYVVGGPLVVYRKAAGPVEAQVYLREPDDALAGKYLTTTAQYLEMYRTLIGPYPHGKFALVENFWETGYGMPSFTLLGPSVIRFPFILHSSYPHEILHNWWGNSVFVDYQTGNWCEGLTAYMADHLIQEQRGKGDEYRRATLQKYRDYVKEGRDFPLTEFRSRHSAATEAVGYGKTLMVFHMLRRRIGDDAFRTAMARLYRGQRGRRTSFRDLQRVFEGVTGEDLGWYFDQWVDRVGAPKLELGAVEVVPAEDSYRIRGTVRQVQEEDPYTLDLPVTVQVADGSNQSFTVPVADRDSRFDLAVSGRPVRLAVDPQFDVFRQLDPRETPPSIGQLFGEPEILAVLPAATDEAEVRGYRELMEGWISDSHQIEVTTDAELEALPADRAVWVLGRANRFAFTGEPPGISLRVGAERAELGGESVPFADHSLVVIERHPDNVEKAVGWLVVEPPAALAGIARKLPHYGKYSYLAFEGDEPTNVVKGQWDAADSPLRVDLRPASEQSTDLPPLVLEKRAALAELPSVFSERDLAGHVEYLASPELEGRGLCSQGLEAASRYVSEQLAAAGLTPGGDDDGWFQRLTVDGPGGKSCEVENVIGYVPGSRAEWGDQSVILSAHYDHLGRGWPDVHEGDEGKIHPGADDNASGVAVLLELAKSYAAGARRPRNLVFVAFTGEEAGKLGSKYFVAHPEPFPRVGIRAVVNLDTVGRLGDAKISFLGTGSAEEWPHIVRGVGFTTGIDAESVPVDVAASDQSSFVAAGIPGVQVFARATPDYHRPTDTADKIDLAGMVKVATFVQETVSYLLEREEPLTATIGEKEPEAATPAAASGGSGRRVRFGTVPDFSYPGPGARVGEVSPGSPAAKAGMQKGDVILRIDDQEVADLAGFSQCLKALEPGQEVRVTVQRGEETLTLSLTAEAR